jgi:hypothetical protein
LRDAREAREPRNDGRAVAESRGLNHGPLPRRGAAGKMKGENMKRLFATVLVAGTLAGFGAAEAAQGCGPGFHRGPYGGCRPNGGAVIVAPRVVAPRVVVAPPVVVVPRGRGCPYGFAWRYGRCRPI